jgi:hypothetical protein
MTVRRGCLQEAQNRNPGGVAHMRARPDFGVCEALVPRMAAGASFDVGGANRGSQAGTIIFAARVCNWL